MKHNVDDTLIVCMDENSVWRGDFTNEFERAPIVKVVVSATDNMVSRDHLISKS